MELELRGDMVHSHFGNYAIRGSQKNLLIDTGHPMHEEIIEAALDEFLQGEAIDYIFPTHAEFPHCGLLSKWMRKFPKAIVVGDVRDYPLYYPEEAERFHVTKIGDSVDLGDRKFVFVPAIWADLKDTFWGFDTGDRILFVADGFAFAHHHWPGECGLTTRDLPLPNTKTLQVISELTLQWTRFTDSRETFAALDELIRILDPRFIAPAHGSVIDNMEVLLPLIKQGMTVMQELAPQS